MYILCFVNDFFEIMFPHDLFSKFLYIIKSITYSFCTCEKSSGQRYTGALVIPLTTGLGMGFSTRKMTDVQLIKKMLPRGLFLRFQMYFIVEIIQPI